MQLTVALADGTKASKALTVSRSAQCPLYIPLYGGKGCLLSWLEFTNPPPDDLTGDLVWIKPGMPSTKYYMAGFTLDSTAAGLRYNQPGSGEPVIHLTDGLLVLQGGGLAQGFTQQLRFNAAGQVTNLSSKTFTLTFTRSSGLFSGKLSQPAISAKPITFTGAVLQQRNTASGFFLSTNQSGRVWLGPPQ